MTVWAKAAILAAMAAAILFVVTRPAAGSVDAGPAGAPASSTAVGTATITLNVVRPTSAKSVVFTGPVQFINTERTKLNKIAASGVLPTGESEVILDGDQHQGQYVCSASSGTTTFTIYGTGLSSSTCKDLTTLAQDQASPTP